MGITTGVAWTSTGEWNYLSQVHAVDTSKQSAITHLVWKSSHHLFLYLQVRLLCTNVISNSSVVVFVDCLSSINNLDSDWQIIWKINILQDRNCKGNCYSLPIYLCFCLNSMSIYKKPTNRYTPKWWLGPGFVSSALKEFDASSRRGRA